MLPWLQPDRFPLYLAPMAGVTDLVFRGICKEMGAEVMVTEFVSAEGILRADERTRKYTEFTEEQRPLGVQLFGGDGARLGEAARHMVDLRRPDFIDINFGCPVNKVVSKNGGSSLLRDCPLLASVANGIVKAVGDQTPVTAKMRIGWDSQNVNAVEVARVLEDCGVQAIAVHGRTRAQGYTGLADWDVIDAVASAVNIPVIGNGDLATGEDVAMRMKTTRVRGVMIGRAAMGYPWVFQEARHFLETGLHLPPPTAAERWRLILRHVKEAVAWGRYGKEGSAVQAMRSRLMAYSRGLSQGKALRVKFSQVGSVGELEELAGEAMADKLAGGQSAA